MERRGKSNSEIGIPKYTHQVKQRGNNTQRGSRSIGEYILLLGRARFVSALLPIGHLIFLPSHTTASKLGVSNAAAAVMPPKESPNHTDTHKT